MKETKTKRIEKYLRQQIKDGVWKQGETLPQSKALAKKLDASEFILREAMLPLIREGILGRKTRIGTYVLSEKQVINGKILILDTKNVQYSASSISTSNYISKQIDIIKEKNLNYKLSIGTNNIPIKELIKQLQLDNTYFLKDVSGIINNISFLPNSIIKSLGIHTINFSTFFTDRENEIIYDLEQVYFNALNLLSLFCNKIAIFRSDYKIISQLEGDYSKKRNQQIEKSINEFKDTIYKDVEIDFYTQTYINIYNIFKETIKNNPNIDGVFISEPIFIPAIHHAIKDMGINIPNDLKIICVTDIETNFGFDLTWTRYELNTTNIQEKAINILLKKIKGENVLNKITIFPKLIKGNSLFK